MSFLISVYLNDTCPQLSYSQIAALAACFPAGLLVSNLIPGHFYAASHDLEYQKSLCLLLQFGSCLSTVRSLYRICCPLTVCTICVKAALAFLAPSFSGGIGGALLKGLLFFGMTLGLGVAW